MLRMILGEAGAGKTTEVLRQIREAAARQQSVLLLVPEHASFEMERRVSALFTGEEQQYITLLSFPRLAENIFRECGGLTSRPLDEVSRALLMREAIDEVQEQLGIYRRQAGYTGFLSDMLQTVADFKRAGITPQGVAELAEQTVGALGEKLRDMSLIYEAFAALVEQRFHDPLDELSLALQRAAEKDWFAGKHIWVDSFDYFSVSERALLEQMLLSASQLTLSMTCPSLDPGEDIFLYQKKFLLRLRAYAGAHRCACEEPLFLTGDERHKNSPDLAALRQAFTDPGTVAPVTGDALRLIEAPTVYEEMRFAAAEISRLVRQEGCRYRDCVILCRDMERYRNAKTVLEEYQLPYFCGEKQNILLAPLPFYILTALEAAVGGIKTAAVLRLARSAASGLDPQQAGQLENYCFVWNIGGEDWLRSFTANPEGLSDAAAEDYAAELAKIEAARRIVMEPLEVLRQALRSADGVGFATAVYRYVAAADALTHLTAGCEMAEREAIDRQWNCIVDVLDLMSDFYTGKTLSAREWSDLFRLALSRIDLGSVPNTVDHVLLAESDRVRLQSPRAVFVLGVNEGVFPAVGKTAGLFSAREREELNARGTELPVIGTESALREQFVLYSALTAPAQRLYITYARRSIAGDTALAPASYLLRTIRPLNITAEPTEQMPLDFWVVNRTTAKSRCAAALGRRPEEEALLSALLERLGEGDYPKALTRAAADLPAAGITPENARALLGRELRLAPTAIDRFYQCPYFFFCDKMLRLRPRQRVEFSPFESGSAIHYVFQQMVNCYGSDGLSTLTDDELDGGIRRYLREYIDRMIPNPDAVTARFRYQFDRLRLMLGVIVRHLAAEFAQSEFFTAATEVSVGEGGEVASPRLAAEDGTPILLRGSIDRVDLYHGTDGDYLRVIDYKSGTKEFKFEEVSYGLNMQMLIYLYAACGDEGHRFGTPQPAGVLYLPSRLEAVNTTADLPEEGVEEAISKALRMKGMLLEDETVLRAMEQELAGVYIPAALTQKGELSKASRVYSREAFEKLRETVYGNITGMGTELLAGKVAPLPARGGGNDPCGYCPYAGLCNNNKPDGCHRELGGEEEGQ